MNIAILIPTLAYGGAERVAAELSKYFSNNGNNIYIFTEARRSEKYDFTGKIIQLKDGYYSGFNSWYGTVSGLLKRAVEMRRLKVQYKIDVSISFMELYNMVNVLSRTTDKVIVRVCTVLSVRNIDSKLYDEKLIKCLYNRADCVVAISNYIMRDLAKTYKVGRGRIKVIPNSVETSVEQPMNDNWIYGENVIICLARLCNAKQQRLLIEIFSRVKKKKQSAKLLLVGNDEGEYAVSVKKTVKKLGLVDDVVFTGHISNTKYYLEHSKLFVLLSKVEGFGNSTIEALSVGIPVICMDSPGASREILAPRTRIEDLNQVEYAEYGILVPFIDENIHDEINEIRKNLICDVIVNVIDNDILCVDYANRGKFRASLFSMAQVGKMWNKIIEEC